MQKEVNKACGIDVHKKFLEVAILERYSEEVKLHKIKNDVECIAKLRELLKSKKVERNRYSEWENIRNRRKTYRIAERGRDEIKNP